MEPAPASPHTSMHLVSPLVNAYQKSHGQGLRQPLNCLSGAGICRWRCQLVTLHGNGAWRQSIQLHLGQVQGRIHDGGWLRLLTAVKGASRKWPCSLLADWAVHAVRLCGTKTHGRIIGIAKRPQEQLVNMPLVCLSSERQNVIMCLPLYTSNCPGSPKLV